ncbi:hypothetical protein Tco_0878278 [Tanacetum coccineum]|uniref:Retrovirus-related Pol polyprotein from transposon TNT 1-94 n=1 Tax=Tanacetum coccineum TaxID=301880 RepID=A0ABQ5C0R3_9ASTR
MAVVNDVPQLVDKKGGSYTAIAPKLEPGKFNKWKNRMLYYLAGIEPYYIKCIKDGPFQPKTAEGDAKPESQWTQMKRKKHGLTLFTSFEGPFQDTKENGTWILNMSIKLSKGLEECQSLTPYSKPCNNYVEYVYEDNLIRKKEEVSDEEEVTQVKVLMALADDELTVGKSHARNGEWVDITIRKVNTLLSMDEDADWKNYLKYINIDLNEQIPHQKKKVLGGELFTESSSKMNENENLFVPASMGILVLESQAINESLEPSETLNTLESSKYSEAESLTPLPPLKNLQGASLSSKIMPLTF